jgi:hypothetical protein
MPDTTAGMAIYKKLNICQSQYDAWSLVNEAAGSPAQRWRRFRCRGYQTDLIGKAHCQPLESWEEYDSFEQTEPRGVSHGFNASAPGACCYPTIRCPGTAYR